MAISLDAAQRFRYAVFGFEHDTRADRTLLPALTRNTELVRMPVAGACNHF